MKYLIIFLFPLLLNAQRDKAAHYWAAFGLTFITGEITYQLTDRKWLSAGIGWGAGTSITWGKEYIWDGYLKRGVKSNSDALFGTGGSTAGAITVVCKLDFCEKRYYEKIDTLKFNDLNSKL